MGRFWREMGGGGQEGHRSQEGGKGADLAVVQAKGGIQTT